MLRAILLTLCMVAACVSALTTPTAELPDCFLSMGDWGYTDPNVVGMSTQMQKIIENPQSVGCNNVSLLLALGDNFYPSGVSSIHDSQWQTTFIDQFRKFPAFKNFPIYPALGDHDYSDVNPQQRPNITKAMAQVEYSKVDPYWRFPGGDTNYTFTQNFGTNKKILFIVVDSEAIHTCIHQPQYCFKKDQPQWLDAMLEKADEDTSITATVVIGHHAIVCPLGGHYDPLLDAVFVPIGRKHRVSMFLTGHSHFLAWSSEGNLTTGKYNKGDMWYVINGAGRGAAAYQCWWHGLNMPLADPKNKKCFPYNFNEQGAFVVHRVQETGFDHCAVNSMNGTMVQCLKTTYRS